ncbi:apolipoprotein N-acyltransferase [Sphingomonas abietis]|uniref:Apolipoprotein N-acyltransferase n=1 Tax=Sphingomonas abietis TaxID=3012344 RepID=A0ABY7NK08_9SPHN|nr:apolipoprotein N-acyltransferase [Sphingomonas abietis]WBO21882.1 apolipoprotein N-acyltransferase [Sphingomonas abietis]
MAPFAIALLLGILSAFGFAPFGLWPLTLLGFGVLYLPLARAQTRWQAALIGGCFGLGQFVLGLDWIAKAFTYQANMPAWLGWVAVVLLSVYLAVYPALAALAAWWGTRRIGGGGATMALLFGASWAVCEWLRGTMFTGFPWNPVAVTMIDLPLGGAARFVGTYALSGLVVTSAGFILILATRPKEALTRRTIAAQENIPAVIGIALLVGVYLVPALLQRFSPPARPPMPKGPVVHIVQPDIGQGERWSPQLAAQHLATEQALSGSPDDKPRLILWPESGIEANVLEDPVARQQVAAMLGPKDVLLGGGESPIRDKKGDEVEAGNSIFAIGYGGQLIARYDKAHLVPWGEYLPMRPLMSAIGLSRLVPGAIDFRPGPGPATVDVPGFGRVGMQLCYEMVFSGHVVNEAYRPDFIFNPSNDAWFGRSGPPQHLAQARLRAIEEGLPIARATPNGISALIDADGRILHSIGANQSGMIELPLPAARAPTLFSHLGNMAVLLIALLLGGLAFAARRYKESFI